ncbi:hypothetical protein, partial [Pseudomonas aeruginosa]
RHRRRGAPGRRSVSCCPPRRRADGGEEMVFKGLETVRTDWSPLAQRFQQELYLRIFNRQPYQDYVRDYVRRTLAG